ncbi:alpha/beta hydrolase fold protein [Planoprotostelium fungivorum]|uniref:Alpha/beta hydrolase fold protein n=1 Tax=Planoprotostelium fungivorum TaxID=1890364 RepID=A0A2P6N9C1_9EUKA|nr:alpha/beta hydrolase fold protein [Planoprotostelium fungivorum]
MVTEQEKAPKSPKRKVSFSEKVSVHDLPANDHEDEPEIKEEKTTPPKAKEVKTIGDVHPDASPILISAAVGALVFRLILLIFLLTASLAGFNQIKNLTESAELIRPGDIVDVTGGRYHFYCQGSGSPAVLLFPDLGSGHAQWASIQSIISTFTRVCVWDRPGVGFSHSPLRPHTPQNAVQDLRYILKKTNELGPFILAGQRAGAMEAQLYASKYSREIAGLVVVDPFSPALAAGDYLSSQLIGTQGSLYKNLGFAAHFGLIRLALLSGLHLHPLEISTPLSTLSKSIVDHDFNRCMKFHRNFTDLHSGTYWMDTVRTIQDHSNGLNQLYNNRYNFSFDPRATRGLFSAPVGQSLSENQAWARHQQNMKELLSENTVTVVPTLSPFNVGERTLANRIADETRRLFGQFLGQDRSAWTYVTSNGVEGHDERVEGG